MLSPLAFCATIVSACLAAADVSKPESEIPALLKRYAAANQKYLSALEVAKSREQRDAVKRELCPKPVPKAKQYIEWAGMNPRHKSAVPVLMLIIANGGRSPSVRDAVGLLAKNHRDLSPDAFLEVVRSSDLPPATTIAFLTAFQKYARNRGTKAQAYLVHAIFKVGAVRVAQMMSTPEFVREMEKRGDKELVGYLKKLDVSQTNAEAARLFERVITEFADVSHHGKSLADHAKPYYDSVTKVAIGKRAPEIDGRDVSGKALKLSDFRGKVVVISFWGTSCKPCMAMLPDEKKLVDRMKGRPFVLLGVNADVDRKKLADAIEKHGITWPNLWDGRDPKLPICRKWLISAWPTIVVLDHKGVIRFKHLRGRKLDAVVERLVKQAEQ